MWMVRRSIQVKRRHYTYAFSVECSDSYMCFTTLRNEQFHRINRLRPDTATTLNYTLTLNSQFTLFQKGLGGMGEALRVPQ